jgi:hypothetical protein
MKFLLGLVALMLCLTRVDAAYLKLNGDLTWNVTDPQCSFRLKGKLQNLGPTTGSLRLALWATTVPYPAGGTLVAEFPLGQLGGGYQFENFTFKTKATLPPENGQIYYTITVMEFTTAGWRNQLMVPTGTQTMFQGQFADQKKWKLPRRRLVDPPARLGPGNLVILNEKAMSNLNLFPAGWRQRYKLEVKNETVIEYEDRNLDEKVDFEYKVSRRKYLGRRADVGVLELEYTGKGNIKFTEKVYLFFQGPNRGTYMSSVQGSLWGESTNPWKAWGTFRLK